MARVYFALKIEKDFDLVKNARWGKHDHGKQLHLHQLQHQS
jgi:hypothetical protein